MRLLKTTSMQRILILLWSVLCLFINHANAGTRGHVMAFIDISLPPLNDGKTSIISLRKLQQLADKPCWVCTNGDRQ